MSTRDKGLHCKGRVCIFLRWSSLLPRGREQATDPRAVPVVSLSPTFPHPLLHLLTHTHTNTAFYTTKADIRDLFHWAMSEKCHAAHHSHNGRSPIYWINLSMITLIWDIQRVSIYVRKLKSVKPPEIPGMGVSVSWQKKKWKESERNNVIDKHASQHNTSIAITDTRRRCFSLPSPMCHPHTAALFHSSVSQTQT